MRNSERVYIYFMIGAISGKLWGLPAGILFPVIALVIIVTLWSIFEKREHNGR